MDRCTDTCLRTSAPSACKPACGLQRQGSNTSCWQSAQGVLADGCLTPAAGAAGGRVRRRCAWLIRREASQKALYELGDSAAADALLSEYLPLIRETCLPDHLIVAHRLATRIAWLAGDPPRALEQLNTLQALGDARGVARLGVAAAIDRSRLALLAGDIANARHALALAVSLSPSTGTLLSYSEDLDDLEIARFRIALVAADGKPDIERMVAALSQAENNGRARRGVRLAWLLAQAHHVADRPEQARIWLEHALSRGQAWQVQQIFADEPWHLEAILAWLMSRQHVFDPRYLERLVRAAQVTSQPGTQRHSEHEGLLSPRELQIIRRVADGHSNKALARLLFVTENTIETHLRRINGKLGTGNRTQAVARARELGVL